MANTLKMVAKKASLHIYEVRSMYNIVSVCKVVSTQLTELNLLKAGVNASFDSTNGSKDMSLLSFIELSLIDSRS